MARNPNSIDKINYITAFLVDHCDAPLQVYVKSLWPALLEAFATWYALDMVQIYTAWVRPDSPLRGVRGGGHGQSRDRKENEKKPRKAPKGRFRTFIDRARVYIGFDPWDAMGKNLQMGAGVTARAVTPGVETLWEIYGLEQKLLYWFMIYEVTVDFFYTWSNGVAMSSYCQQQYRPWVFTEKASLSDPGVPGGAGVPLPPATKARWGYSGPGNNMSSDSTGSICIATATSTAVLSGAGMSLKLIGRGGAVFESAVVNGPGQEMTVRAEDPYEGDWFVVLDARGIGFAENLRVTLIGNPTDGGVYHYPTDWRENYEKSFRPAGYKGKKSWADKLLGN